MARSPYAGFGGMYTCPVCSQRCTAGSYRRFGPFSVHKECTVTCQLCGEEITPPAIGKNHTIQPYLNRPVHTTCKENRT